MLRPCPRCHTGNAPGANYCRRCGLQQPGAETATASAATPRPRLHEEILLLALHDQRGTIEREARLGLRHALSAGIMGEMLLAERIEVEPNTRKFVTIADQTEIGEPVVDGWLAAVARRRRRSRLRDWIDRIAQTRDLTTRVARRLCLCGILEWRADRLLLIFTRDVYPTRQPQPEQHAIRELSEAIFCDTREVDQRTVILLSLADRAGLWRIPFEKEALQARRNRVTELVDGEIIGEAMRDAILRKAKLANLVPPKTSF